MCILVLIANKPSLSLMTSISARRPRSNMNLAKNTNVGILIPNDFRCPISLELMKDPVTLPTGITYDRQSIERWLETGSRTCPVSNKVLDEYATDEDIIIPNHSIRRMIQDWCVANQSFGIERIPTPPIPITLAIAVEMLTKIASAARDQDRNRCGILVRNLVASTKKCERNKRYIEGAGADHVLATSFEVFAKDDSVVAEVESSKNVFFEEILSALTLVFPLDKEALRHIGSPESLDRIVSILKFGTIAGRLNAALVVKELVSSGKECLVGGTQGLVQALTKLIREPVSPQITKASLTGIYYMVSADEKLASEFAEMNLVSLLVEKLVDLDKSTCEKVLAVLDGIFGSETGREKGREHVLTIPVLVKKMFRVSAMATEFAVSALWRLCKALKEECLIEAVQVGAFQKLLLLLQVGCCEITKEKVSELLKLMNGYRELECIETMDFKGLKRSF
ncbi:U-box domain-containing protein 21-like [Dioscorea cayenensis subsp. rotundata]|uniref:U-box domain-containing protein n=1 Tax=Dioscorea cayennensis subsp. rotundata TaxID=55577 RepID=A0AB40CXB8_DIOCR|nr:U-box domain-containing protein 21-like [Dioscorea cayenensis subsp. rotundata]